MAKEHFVVIAYDIPNNKRRTRLHKKLKDFGNPIQYSVFECLLDRDEIVEMKAAVDKIIKPRLDHLRYYHLCGSCRKKIDVIGRSEIVQRSDVLFV